MRDYSLRTKLVGAIGFIICAASAPFVYFAYHDALESSTEAFEERFGKITQILNEDLSLSYLNGQTLLTEKIAIEKDEIVRSLDQIESALSEGELRRLGSTLDFLEAAWGSSVLITDAQGRVLHASNTVRGLVDGSMTDYLGVPLRDYLKVDERSIFRDHFTFVRLGDERRPYLVAVRKVGERMVLYFEDVKALEDRAPEHLKSIEGHLIDTVRTMVIGPETSFRVLDGEGRVIAGRGDETPSLALLRDDRFMTTLRREGRLAGFYGEGSLKESYRAQYFDVLDWTIHASIPERVITEPALRYARNAILMVGVVLALVILVGLFLVSRLLRPLTRVSATAKRLETVDFAKAADEGGLKPLVEGMPVAQKDEIGDVSRAFSNMVVALEKNIGDLKTTLARQHNIQGELNAAHEIQLGMLPDASEGFVKQGIRSAAVMDAAKEVGGDFYDVFSLEDGREVLVLGDVSGKGVSAALFMCVTLTLLRNALADGLAPGEAMAKVNDQLAANNPNCMFVTLWIGIYDPARRLLLWANGGHPAPAVLSREAGPVRWLREMSGPLVGVFEGTPFTTLETPLEPGEVVFVYSDGVSEAMNEEKALFAEAGMEKVFASAHGLAPQAVIDRMMEAIVDYRGTAEQSDDITMLVFEGTDTKGDGK